MNNFIAGLLLTSVMVLIGSATQAHETISSVVDTKGKIMLPDDFRAEMSHLGSWFVPEGEASGFHDVYMDSSSLEKYRVSGEFPDGAVIVKELRSSKSGSYTTGKNVFYATGNIKQWFVMVKDTEGRFKENPLWGDGWGWALFKPDNPKKNVAKNYKTDCLGCHVPAQSNDWIYKEAYPSLKK